MKLDKILTDTDYQTGKTYGQLLDEIKEVLTYLDEEDYSRTDALKNAIFLGHKAVMQELYDRQHMYSEE